MLQKSLYIDVLSHISEKSNRIVRNILTDSIKNKKVLTLSEKHAIIKTIEYERQGREGVDFLTCA